jgi:hypothetical protein
MPYLDFHIVARSGYHPVLFIKLQRGYEVLMCVLYFFLLFPKVQVPYPYRLVVRDRVQVLPVRMHRQGSNPVVMTRESG